MSWELGQALSSILPSFWDDMRIHHAEDQAGGRKSPRALPRGLDHLDRLVDIESPLDGVGYDGIWDIGKGLASNERDTLGSEIEVVVLDLGRPVIEQAELEAGADQRACATAACCSLKMMGPLRMAPRGSEFLRNAERRILSFKKLSAAQCQRRAGG